ncbi:unnamed protein product [Closterium sp. Yama58-4]|nr:unnamed protein product [Closterium sp. Yama58-4]
MQRPELLGRLKEVSSTTQRRSASNSASGGSLLPSCSMDLSAGHTPNAQFGSGNGGPPLAPTIIPMTMCSQTGQQLVANPGVPLAFSGLQLGGNGSIRIGDSQSPSPPDSVPPPAIALHRATGLVIPSVPPASNSTGECVHGSVGPANGAAQSPPEIGASATVAPSGASGFVIATVPPVRSSLGINGNGIAGPANSAPHSAPEISAPATVAPPGATGFMLPTVQPALDLVGLGVNGSAGPAAASVQSTLLIVAADSVAPNSAPSFVIPTVRPVLDSVGLGVNGSSGTQGGSVDANRQSTHTPGDVPYNTSNGATPPTPGYSVRPGAATTATTQGASSSFNWAARSSFRSGGNDRNGARRGGQRRPSPSGTRMVDSVARGDEMTETCSVGGNGRMCTAKWTHELTTDLLTIILQLQQAHGLQPHDPVGSWRDVHLEWTSMHADYPYTAHQLENRLRVVKRWLPEIKWLQDQVLAEVSGHQMWRERAHRWQNDIAPWLDLAAQLDSNGGTRGGYATTGDEGPRVYPDDPGALGKEAPSEGTAEGQEVGDEEEAVEGYDSPNGVDGQTNASGLGLGDDCGHEDHNVRATSQPSAHGEGARARRGSGGTASPGRGSGGGSARSRSVRNRASGGQPASVSQGNGSPLNGNNRRGNDSASPSSQGTRSTGNKRQRRAEASSIARSLDTLASAATQPMNHCHRGKALPSQGRISTPLAFRDSRFI